MNIIHSNDVNSIKKPEGIFVRYYLFNDYEIHYNEQQPGTTQVWHFHEKVSETILIIEGELECKWLEDGTQKVEIIKPGDLVECQNSIHTFSNISDKIVKFVVLKRIDSNQDYREIFKTDKFLK